MSSVLASFVSNYSLVRTFLMFHDVITNNVGSWSSLCLIQQAHGEDDEDGDDLDVTHGYCLKIT